MNSGYAADEIIVSAAASLTNAMTAIGMAFEKEHPETHIIFNFAASGSLVQQMLHGAPVDVFASASQKFMDDAQKYGLIREGSRKNFARNTLVLAAPPGAPPSLKDIADIALPVVQLIGIGNPENVPAGRYAKEVLEANKLWEQVQAKLVYGNSVRQILDYLRRGEVDAGLIYATDAVIGGDEVQAIETIDTQTPIVYPLAITTNSQNLELSQQFVEFIIDESGQTILSNFGFASPQERARM